jgi:hypothetical protein
MIFTVAVNSNQGYYSKKEIKKKKKKKIAYGEKNRRRVL